MFADNNTMLVRTLKAGTLLGGLSYMGYVIYQNRFKILAKIKVSRHDNHKDTVEYKGYYFSKELLKAIHKLEESFVARPDDIYVCTFPKAGTTWTQELVYTIQHTCDFTKAKSDTLEERFPFLDLAPIFGRLHVVEKMESPRLIKTHLPFEVLPDDIKNKKCKIIYCTRNPKDVAVSLYYFTQFLVMDQFKGSFEEFFEFYDTDKSVFAPYWEHNLRFWELRDQENILFLKYEDMQKDCMAEARKIAKFLNKELNEEQLAQVVDHCTFKKMKTNNMTNYTWMVKQGLADDKKTTFMRKGTVGDWKNYFTVAMNEKMDKKYREKMAGSGLTHDFELEMNSNENVME